jgi:DNA-binding SARP family transcriptional activator
METAAASPPSITVRLLGSFAVEVDGEPLPITQSTQRLIAFLALQRGPVRRLCVAGQLWLDAPEDRAMARLRTALWRAPHQPTDVIVSFSDQLALAPGVRVDAVAAERAAERELARPELSLPTAADVELLFRCEDLLPDWYDDWVLRERERLEHLRQHALEAQAVRLAQAGCFGPALMAALGALAGGPLRETAHRALIITHLAQGNVVDAIRQYDRCRELLERELCVAPSAELQALVAPFLTPA